MLYKDAKAPIEERIEDLLSRMTLKEKVIHWVEIISRIIKVRR